MKLVFIPLLFLVSLVGAQKTVYLNPNSVSQIRFSVTPALYSPMEIHNEGVSILRSITNLGAEISISFVQMIWSGFGIEAGLGYGMIPYSFSYRFKPAPGSPLYEGLISVESDEFSSAPGTNFEDVRTFPITLIKLFPLVENKHLFLNLAAGVKLNIPVNFPVYITGGSTGNGEGIGESIQYLTYELESGSSKNYISYNFKAGLIKNNSRSNSFYCNFVYQYTPSMLLTGSFEFHELGYPSQGTFELHNNYIGLELSYGLTLGKKIRHL